MTRIPLLLANPSACFRWLVLRELLHRPGDDPEVRELMDLRQSDPLIANLLRMQASDGSWKMSDLGWPMQGRKLRATTLVLMRLGYFGFGADFPAVQHAAEFIFSQQQKDGAWPLAKDQDDSEEQGNYSMVPLQTALPLRGLAACGYAQDPRTERAYDWLLAQRLPDGAWPTGIASGNFGYVAGYRRLAHSRWGCRSNTTGALICIALHPERRRSPEARRAFDLLLGCEIREKNALGFEVARLIGAEPARGFFTFYAKFDSVLILDLCWRVGASQDDERITDLLEFVVGLQGSYGLWEYASRPQASCWLTFDLLRSLSRLDETGEWLSLEPRTPFQKYFKKVKRF